MQINSTDKYEQRKQVLEAARISTSAAGPKPRVEVFSLGVLIPTAHPVFFSRYVMIGADNTKWFVDCTLILLLARSAFCCTKLRLLFCFHNTRMWRRFDLRSATSARQVGFYEAADITAPSLGKFSLSGRPMPKASVRMCACWQAFCVFSPRHFCSIA